MGCLSQVCINNLFTSPSVKSRHVALHGVTPTSEREERPDALISQSYGAAMDIDTSSTAVKTAVAEATCKTVADITAAAPLRQSETADRQRFTSGVCLLVFLTGGTFYSFSSLVIPISQALELSTIDADSLEDGIVFYGFAIMVLVGNTVAAGASFLLVKESTTTRRHFVNGGMASWVSGVALMAAAVEFRSVLLLFLAFPALGVGVGCVGGYLQLVEMPRWWSERVHVAMAITGLSIGGGALFWTLFFGELIHYVGMEHVATVLWITLLIQAVIAGAVFSFCHPGRNLAPSQEHKHEADKEVFEPGDSGEAESVSWQEVRVVVDDKQRELSLRELCRDWRLFAFLYTSIAFQFAGTAMKNLLSIMFEEILALSYIEAIHYSASCLALYAGFRALSPLLAGTGGNVFALFTGVLLAESLAYGLTPWAIQTDEKAGIYTFFRLVGGAAFAVLLANRTVLLVRVFGVANVPKVSGLFFAIEWVAGIGPGLAFALRLQQIQDGKARQESFNSFFVLCSVVVALAAVCVILLWCAQRAGGTREPSFKVPAPEQAGRTRGQGA
eukprot:TRINITY_DN90569_c0_g1_i1.p1 TRINITY_DN90569_c0_g1~~TRINITY_DN90569_c0_g1_i1.p1  ORF type:complete len:558 (-),score=61.39 TRINITY_DN90569_c0_g1_i1:45-1718(-)